MNPGPPPCSRVSRCTGFTLTEWLVTMGVIATLLLLLTPVANRVVGEARSAKCISNLRHLAGGIAGFAAEHNGTIPPDKAFRSDANGNEAPGGDVWYRHDSMWAYRYIVGNWAALTPMLRCPSDRTKSTLYYYHSYTWSHYLLIHWRDGKPRDVPAYVKLWNVQNKVLILDGVVPADENPAYSGSASGPGPLTTSNAKGIVGDRHNGGANCLLGDGSVRQIAKQELIQNRKLWQ